MLLKSVYLPRAEEGAEVDRAAVEDQEAVERGSETLLLVEDEQAVRFVSRAILERAGYRVLDASDPMSAHALFEQHAHSIDLLVTDVIMPGSTGPQLFERLAATRPGLRVLYMSGYTDDAIVHQGVLDPGIAFLQKPFSAGGLARRVREALDR